MHARGRAVRDRSRLGAARGWAFYPSHYLEDVDRVGALVPFDDVESTAHSRDGLLADIAASLTSLE